MGAGALALGVVLFGGFALPGRLTADPVAGAAPAGAAPIDAGAATTPEMRAALSGLADAEARVTAVDGPLERLGLVLGGLDEARARAAAARRAGDAQAVEAAAGEVRAYADGAAGNGVQRVVGTTGFVVLAGFVAVLGRRRRQWAPGAPDDDGTAGELDGPGPGDALERPTIELVDLVSGDAGRAPALVVAGR